MRSKRDVHDLASIGLSNQFLGIEWHFWKVLGWIGNAVFFSRFFVQWIATEKRKEVVVPLSFWWLSLVGSVLLLIYGLRQRDSVFIFAYAFTWIPYIRSLVIYYRRKAAQKECLGCQAVAAGEIRFCQRCGSRLRAAEGEETERTIPLEETQTHREAVTPRPHLAAG